MNCRENIKKTGFKNLFPFFSKIIVVLRFYLYISTVKLIPMKINNFFKLRYYFFDFSKLVFDRISIKQILMLH